MKRLFKEHPIIITISAMMDLFGGSCYTAWANITDAPVSMIDAYVMIGIVIDAVSLIIVGSIHKDWFFDNKNGEDQ